MSNLVIHDMVAFVVPGQKFVLAALAGDGTSKVHGAALRRWKSLRLGTEKEIVKEACSLAAQLEEDRLRVKGKPDICAEDFIGMVRKSLLKAAPMGTSFPNGNQAQIRGFMLRVQRDAIATYTAMHSQGAATFLGFKPVERTPQQSVVLEKLFPPTTNGYAVWDSCLIPASYLQAYPVVQGLGEY